jgi:hypothetical protein
MAEVKVRRGRMMRSDGVCLPLSARGMESEDGG